MGEERWDGIRWSSEVWEYSRGRMGFGRGWESGCRVLVRGCWLERVRERRSEVGDLVQMGGQTPVLLLSMKALASHLLEEEGTFPQML